VIAVCVGRSVSGRRLPITARHPRRAYTAGLVLTNDGHSLWATAPAANEVVELDTDSGRLLRKISAPSPDQLAFSKDGSLLPRERPRSSKPPGSPLARRRDDCAALDGRPAI
jgi:hypothetical protein